MFLFLLGFSCASFLLWFLLRRRGTVAVWPFVLGAFIATALASFVYLELFFQE